MGSRDKLSIVSSVKWQGNPDIKFAVSGAVGRFEKALSEGPP
jgi:hypothetical protein